MEAIFFLMGFFVGIIVLALRNKLSIWLWRTGDRKYMPLEKLLKELGRVF
jgi:hypothetical protein